MTTPLASSPPSLSLIGANPALLWGMTNAERLARLARAEGMTADPEATDTRLHVNLDRLGHADLQPLQGGVEPLLELLELLGEHCRDRGRNLLVVRGASGRRTPRSRLLLLRLHRRVAV